jgi:hypothetical protein
LLLSETEAASTSSICSFTSFNEVPCCAKLCDQTDLGKPTKFCTIGKIINCVQNLKKLKCQFQVIHKNRKDEHVIFSFLNAFKEGFQNFSIFLLLRNFAFKSLYCFQANTYFSKANYYPVEMVNFKKQSI